MISAEFKSLSSPAGAYLITSIKERRCSLIVVLSYGLWLRPPCLRQTSWPPCVGPPAHTFPFQSKNAPASHELCSLTGQGSGVRTACSHIYHLVTPRFNEGKCHVRSSHLSSLQGIHIVVLWDVL